MSSIQKRANGRWAVRWRDPDDRQRWKTFTSRSDALDFRKRLDVELLDGATSTRSDSTISVQEHYDDWIARQMWRASTLDQVESHYRRNILPEIGERQICDIAPADLQLLLRDLSSRLAPSTIHIIASHLRGLFKDAVAQRLLAASPADGLRLPAVPRKIVVPPTIEQVTELRRRIDDRYRALIDVAASTGMRQGELFGLTLDRVDEVRCQILVDRQLVLAGGRLEIGPTKTPASVRMIPVPVELVAVVHEHVERFGTNSDGLVFTSHDNDPISRTRFSDAWRRAARPAGFPARQGIHSLRHFYASLLIRQGCSVKVVQAGLGHSTAAETLDTYSHLWDDDDDRTRQAVRAVFEPIGNDYEGQEVEHLPH